MTESLPRWQRYLPVATIAVGLLPILLAPLRARELSPDGRGEFAFFQSAFTIISAAGALGGRHAYYAMRGAGQSDSPLLGPGAAISAWIAAGAVGAPLLVISLFQHSIPTSILIAAILAAGPLHLFVQLQLARAQYERQALRVALTTGVPALWEFVANLVLVAANAMTVLSVSAATAVAEVLRGIVSRRRRAHAPRDLRAVRRKYNRQLWRYAPVGIMPMLVSNIDVIVYGATLPQNELGYYAVAKLAVTLLIFATVVIEGRFVRSEQQFARSALFTLLSLGVTALLGGILGTSLVPPLFGSAYQPAADVFGLMAAVGFVGGAHVLFTARAASRQLGVLALLSSTAVFVTTAAASVIVSQVASDLRWLPAPMGVGYLLGLVILACGLVRKKPELPEERT